MSFQNLEKEGVSLIDMKYSEFEIRIRNVFIRSLPKVYYETIFDQGTPKTSLIANIRAAYYIINLFFHITSSKYIKKSYS